MSRSSTTSSLLTMVVMIAVGVFLFAYPDQTLYIVIRVLGAALLVVGGIGIVSFFLPKNESTRSYPNLILSVIEAVIGAFILFRPDLVTNLFAYIVGIIILLHGVTNLVTALEIKKAGGSWILPTVLAGITIVAGILILLRIFKPESLLIRIIGLVLIYNGVSSLVTALLMKK